MEPSTKKGGKIHLNVLPVVEMLQFGCKRGHKFSRVAPMVVQFDTVASGPICPFCYSAWITQNFGAYETGPRGTCRACDGTEQVLVVDHYEPCPSCQRGNLPG